MKTQRDEFLEVLLTKAKLDSSIVLLSADMGAPAIDQWKAELPKQYFPMGISEQNTINVAAGLSRGGKKVFVYFMGVWIHRCFEQIRYSCAIGQNPITILGNGVGLGYAPAGPAHEPNEDVAVMRTLHSTDIYAASTSKQISGIVERCLDSKRTNYVRLERKTHVSAENAYLDKPSGFFETVLHSGYSPGKTRTVVISYGQVIRRVFELRSQFPQVFEDVSILELSKLWPVDVDSIVKLTSGVSNFLVVEEQSKSGSLAEAIALGFLERGIQKRMQAIHLPSHYIFQNGNQDELLDDFGFSKDSLLGEIELLRKAKDTR